MSTCTPTNIPDRPALKVYLTQTALGRRLGVCPLTVRRKLAAGIIRADAALISGAIGEFVIFDMARLPQFRAEMRGLPFPAAPAIVV